MSSQIHRKQRQEDQAVRADLDDFSKILPQRAKYKIGAELQLSGRCLPGCLSPWVLPPAVIITITNMKHRICTLNTTCTENK